MQLSLFTNVATSDTFNISDKKPHSPKSGLQLTLIEKVI